MNLDGTRAHDKGNAMCCMVTGRAYRSCSRKGVMRAWWSGLWPAVLVCRQHGKKLRPAEVRS